jgi:protein-L-isoaspartate(D-aspartate) O-methyltransferase
MDLNQARFNMIEQQIRPWEVLDPQILELLSVVRREDFVPVAHKALAFVDMDIPLGNGQLMLAPRVQARLVQDLALQKTDKVLEIGAGTGFTTALLASQAAQVLSFEMDASLAAQASANLQQAGIGNATVRHADGSQGAAGEGPQGLLEQLAVGGRLIAITGEEPMMRATLITRTGPASFMTAQPWDANAQRLTGFAEAPAFQF